MKPHTDHIRHKLAIIDGSTGQTRSFQDYHNTMTAVASFLKQELHVQQQDTTLALFAPNQVDYVPICLAAAMCGCKLTPVNPQYKPMELVTILYKSSSQILFVHEGVLPIATEAITILDTQFPTHKLRWMIIIPQQEDTSHHTHDRTMHEKISSTTSSVQIINLDHVKKYPHTMNQPISSSHQHSNPTTSPFLLPYSSGTTGLPKAVCLSQQNIIANLLQLDEVESMPFPSVRSWIFLYYIEFFVSFPIFLCADIVFSFVSPSILLISYYILRIIDSSVLFPFFIFMALLHHPYTLLGGDKN